MHRYLGIDKETCKENRIPIIIPWKNNQFIEATVKGTKEFLRVKIVPQSKGENTTIVDKEMDSKKKCMISHGTLAQSAISTTSMPTTFGRRPSTSLQTFKMQCRRRFLRHQKRGGRNHKQRKQEKFKSYLKNGMMGHTCHLHCALSTEVGQHSDFWGYQIPWWTWSTLINPRHLFNKDRQLIEENTCSKGVYEG